MMNEEKMLEVLKDDLSTLIELESKINAAVDEGEGLFTSEDLDEFIKLRTKQAKYIKKLVKKYIEIDQELYIKVNELKLKRFTERLDR